MFAYDPLRLAIDVRGTGASGYELARALRERHQVFTELAGENVIVVRVRHGRGRGAPGRAAGGRAAPRRSGRWASAPTARCEEFAPPPPWGELAMSPRDAFLGAQEAVPVADAVGRIAAESLAAYPPGIPNVLPGRAADRGDAGLHPHHARALGGSLRGASDRELERP